MQMRTNNVVVTMLPKVTARAQKVTCGDPGELRRVAPGGEIRPTLPESANFGRNLHKFGQHRPEAAEVGSTVVEFDQTWSKQGRCRPSVSGFRANLAHIRRTSLKLAEVAEGNFPGHMASNVSAASGYLDLYHHRLVHGRRHHSARPRSIV